MSSWWGTSPRSRAKLASPEGSSGVSGDHVQGFTLEIRPQHVMLLFLDGTDFGFFRGNLTNPLHPLLSRPRLKLEGVAKTRDLIHRIGETGTSRDAIVLVSINLYGPRAEADEVGEALSRDKLWLQRPAFLPSQFSYHNPQFLHLPDLERTAVTEQIPNEESTSKPIDTGERLEQLMIDVQESTQRRKEQGRVTVNHGLKTKLLE